MSVSRRGAAPGSGHAGFMPSESLEGDLKQASGAEESIRLDWEREVLGFYLTGHPLHRWQNQLDAFADCSVAELQQRFASGTDTVSVGGLITGLRIIPIKKEGRNKGRKMATFRLEGLDAGVRVVAFPDAYEQCGHLLKDDLAVLLQAEIRGDRDHVELSLESATALETLARTRASALAIQLDLANTDEEELAELREILLHHTGDIPVRFELRRQGRFRARIMPPPALSVDPTPELREAIRQLIPGSVTRLEYPGHAASR